MKKHLLNNKKIKTALIHLRVLLSPVILFHVEHSSYSSVKISAGDLHKAGYLLKMGDKKMYGSGATYDVWWVSLINGKIQIGDELLLKRGDETTKVEVDFS